MDVAPCADLLNATPGRAQANLVESFFVSSCLSVPAPKDFRGLLVKGTPSSPGRGGGLCYDQQNSALFVHICTCVRQKTREVLRGTYTSMRRSVSRP